MATGTVKWFNNAKGYGFIRPDNGGDDIFAHYSTIEMEGYRSLKQDKMSLLKRLMVLKAFMLRILAH